MNHWHRLENLGENYPLLKVAYLTSKSIFDENKPSWYGLIDMVKQLLPKIKSCSKASISAFKAQCKQLLKSYFFGKLVQEKRGTILKWKVRDTLFN
jgi:hypothetical protein